MRVWAIVRGGEVDAERSVSQVERESGVVRWEARRELVVREMRTREMGGRVWARRESWVRKWWPTPPAPGGVCQDTMKGWRGDVLSDVGVQRNEKILKESRAHVKKDFPS